MEGVTVTTSMFPLGQLVCTPGIMAMMEDGLYVMSLLKRHMQCDWGDLCKEDKETNDAAVGVGMRILSAYETSHGKVWIITEADRSATTILLPDEY